MSRRRKTYKRPKAKKRSTNVPAILAGLILILLAFAFALNRLTGALNQSNAVAINTEEIGREEFIKTIAPHAQELQDGYGILPSIIIGQAVLESDFGKSQLASEYKNLFGIKAFGNEKKIKLETQEYVNEQWVTIKGDFRVYNSWAESMDDHTQLFVKGVDWNPQLYAKVLTATDYKQAAKELQQAGYATDPGYADKIISIVEEYKLNQYDR